MTTITDKITKPLEILKVIEDPEEFGELVTLIRNELLGLSDQKIPVKKMTKKFNIEDPQFLQDGIEAMAYLILHMTKIKASVEEFNLLYMQSGLNQREEFRKTMFDIIYPNLD